MNDQQPASAELAAALKSLGASETLYAFNGPNPSVLEAFPSPFDGRFQSQVLIEAPEFTSLCPKTGQPDFAKIVVLYTPRKLCVESKSFKLYLMSFRQAGEFHEACVNRIAADLCNLLDPLTLSVEGQFTPRGGIPFWPKVQYAAPGCVIANDKMPRVIGDRLLDDK